MSRSEDKSTITVDKIEKLDSDKSKYVKPYLMYFSSRGVKRCWELIKTHDSVAIILFNTTRNKLIFVKQFRPAVLFAAATDDDPDVPEVILKDTPVSGYTLEFCAGIIDKQGKSPAEIAREEILEETGYNVPLESLKFVTSMRSGVGVAGSLQNLYFCSVDDSQKVSKGGGVADEQITVIEMDPTETFKILWKPDTECRESRPASFLLALSWFFYEYCTQNHITFRS